MRTLLLSALVVPAALLIAGCGDNGSTTTPTVPPAPTLPATPDHTTPMTPHTGTTGTTGTTHEMPTTASVGAAVNTQADQLIKQTTDYITQNKWDLAQKSVDELEKMKPQLPAEYGPRIDQLKTAVETAKGGTLPGGLKLPGQ